MPIVEVEGTDSKKRYVYTELDPSELYDKRTRLIKLFEQYVSRQGDIDYNDCEIDEDVISELLVRVDKRREYFIIFHEQTEINEMKETALIVYWILKFRPFKIISDNKHIARKYEQINENFSIFLLLGAVVGKLDIEGKKDIVFHRDYIDKMKYAFRYWDISKESVMFIAETLYASQL